MQLMNTYIMQWYSKFILLQRKQDEQYWWNWSPDFVLAFNLVNSWNALYKILYFRSELKDAERIGFHLRKIATTEFYCFSVKVAHRTK
jgi:hypothetical protein